jgi:amino acid transporter
MNWLIEQPIIISFFIICTFSVGISLIGLWFIRKKFPHDRIKENHETASVIFNAYGLLYAVVVAFVVYVTWGTYDKATMDVELEANELMNMYYLSNAYPETVKADLHKQLLDYTKEIVESEWPMQAAGEVSPAAGNKVQNLWNSVLSINTRMNIDENICRSTFETMKRVTDYRRLRMFAIKQNVPGIVWAILLIGGILSVICTYFFGMKNALPQYLLTACFTIIVTLMLYLIYVLDHCFAGTNAISNQPLKMVIEIMMK